MKWCRFQAGSRLRLQHRQRHQLGHRYTTLHPGDVLWMGTRGADDDMVPGDVIEVEIRGIGVLRNYVVAEA